MENIKKLILNILPEAVIEDKTILTVTVEPNKLHLLAQTLRDNVALPFDFLVKLIGMDWGEN